FAVAETKLPAMQFTVKGAKHICVAAISEESHGIYLHLTSHFNCDHAVGRVRSCGRHTDQDIACVERLNASDVLISVPATAPDAADSVVAVEVAGEVKVNPVRLLADGGHTNVLRAFDGELHGGKLRFGDGKAPRAYVYEWSNPKEWIGWKVRVNKPTAFEVAVKYTTGSTACRGSYTVTVGDQVLKATVEPTPNDAQSTTVTLGRISLSAGEHEVTVKPTDIQGGEL